MITRHWEGRLFIQDEVSQAWKMTLLFTLQRKWNEMKASADQQTQTILPSARAESLLNGLGSVALSSSHFSVARSLGFGVGRYACHGQFQLDLIPGKMCF